MKENIFEKTISLSVLDRAKKEGLEKAKTPAKKGLKEKAITKKPNVKKSIKKEELFDPDLDPSVDGEEEVIADTDMEGVYDDIVVVVDPEKTEDEVSAAAQEIQDIIDETPDDECPMTDEYIGDDLYQCPICGQTFVSEVSLDEGDSCPVCNQVPEAFVSAGEIAESEDGESDEDVEEVEVDVEEDFEDEDEDIDIDLDIKDDEEESEKEESVRRRGMREKKDDKASLGLTKPFYKDDKWTIWKVKTFEQSKYLGSGTKWCISESDGKHFFDEYSKVATIYIGISGKNSKVAVLAKNSGDVWYFASDESEISRKKLDTLDFPDVDFGCKNCDLGEAKKNLRNLKGKKDETDLKGTKNLRNLGNLKSKQPSKQIDESTFNPFLNKFITDNYKNAKSFNLVSAKSKGNTLTLECKLIMKSGKAKNVRLRVENYTSNTAVNRWYAKDDGTFKVESKSSVPFIFRTRTSTTGIIKCEGLRYNFVTSFKEGKRVQIHGSMLTESARQSMNKSRVIEKVKKTNK